MIPPDAADEPVISPDARELAEPDYGAAFDQMFAAQHAFKLVTHAIRASDPRLADARYLRDDLVRDFRERAWHVVPTPYPNVMQIWVGPGDKDRGWLALGPLTRHRLGALTVFLLLRHTGLQWFVLTTALEGPEAPIPLPRDEGT